MKTVLKYFVLLVWLNFIEASFRCDYTYSYIAKGWFKHFDVPATWSDARQRCTLEGAVLASPTTQELKSEIINIIQDSKKKTEVFTGIHATLSQVDYRTIEGTPLSEIPVVWAEDEPDNKESCITFNRNGKVAVYPCKDTRPYICYHPEEPQAEFTECGTVDRGYRLDTRTNKCYKFHKQGQTFTGAYSACAAEGGHLAIINSDTEATVLKELYASMPESSLTVTWNNLAYIGFHYWGAFGEWRTIHGQTLSEAGYSKWQKGEPTSYQGEFCGLVDRNGLLFDGGCTAHTIAFICEKSPQYPVCQAVELSLFDMRHAR